MNMNRYVLDGDDSENIKSKEEFQEELTDEYIFDEDEYANEETVKQEEYTREEFDEKYSLFHARKETQNVCYMLERRKAKEILDKHKENVDEILKKEGIKQPISFPRVRITLFTKEHSYSSLRVKETLAGLSQKYNLDIKEICLRSEKDARKFGVYTIPKTVIGGVCFVGSKNKTVFESAIKNAIENGTN